MNGSAGSKAVTVALLSAALLSPSTSWSAGSQEKPAIWIRIMDKADMTAASQARVDSKLSAKGPNGKTLAIAATRDGSGQLFKVEFAGAGLYRLVATAPGCKEEVKNVPFTAGGGNARLGLNCAPPATVGAISEGTATTTPSSSSTTPHDLVVRLRHGTGSSDRVARLRAMAIIIAGTLFVVLAAFGAASFLTARFRKKPVPSNLLDEEMERLRTDVQQLEQNGGAPQQEGVRTESAASAGSDVIADPDRAAPDGSDDHRTGYPTQIGLEPHQSTAYRTQHIDRSAASPGLLDDYQQARIGGDGSQAAEYFRTRFHGIRLSLTNADAVVQSPATRAEFREASRGFFLAVEERGQWKCLPWFSHELSDPTFRIVFDCTGHEDARVVLPLTLIRTGETWTADGRGRIA